MISSIFQPTVIPIEVNSIEAELLFMTTTTTTYSPVIGTSSSIEIPTAPAPDTTMDELPTSDFPSCKEYPGCTDMVAKLSHDAPSDAQLAIQQATLRLQGIIS